MTPPDDNAYDRYRRVLTLDPSNKKAKDGLRDVATRYLVLAETALRDGDASQASSYLEKAGKADASHPDLSAAQARLDR